MLIFTPVQNLPVMARAGHEFGSIIITASMQDKIGFTIAVPFRNSRVSKN